MTRDELKALIINEFQRQAREESPMCCAYVGDEECAGQVCLDGWFDLGKLADAILAKM